MPAMPALFTLWLCATFQIAPPDSTGPAGGLTSQSAAGQSLAHTLLFVPNDALITADHGAVAGQPDSALGQLGDTEIAAFTPGRDSSAVKQLALAELTCLLGDCDKDGQFAGIPWGDIDAVGQRRFGPTPSFVNTPDLLFSTEDVWGGANEYAFYDAIGTVDGTVFALTRKADGSDFLAVPFLREVTVLKAIGQLGTLESDGVDVDAFTQDSDGNVYLSFRLDELVHGVLLADDGVLCLPEEALDFDSAFNITDAEESSAVILLDLPAVNALVVNAGLQTPAGSSIKSLTDLQALELDPGGGRFIPVEAIPDVDGAPDLLFNGQGIGPTVLTTAGGGRIATLNGCPLGTQALSGAPLGLDAVESSGAGNDLNALLVIPMLLPHLCVDVTAAEVDLQDASDPGQIEFVIGSATPNGALLLVLRVVSPVAGAKLASVPAPSGAYYPDLFIPTPPLLAALSADGRGRSLATFDVISPPAVALWIVAQAFDLARHELSPPAGVWCPP